MGLAPPPLAPSRLGLAPPRVASPQMAPPHVASAHVAPRLLVSLRPKQERPAGVRRASSRGHMVSGVWIGSSG